MLSKGQAYFRWWVGAMTLCNFCFSVPYKWDNASNSVKLIGKFHRKAYILTLLLHFTYFIVMCSNLGLHYQLMTLPDCLKSLVVIFSYACCGISRLTFYIWETDFLLLLNTFLHFEKNLLQRFSGMDPLIRKGSIYTFLVFGTGTASTATFGFLIFMLLCMQPCTPPYIASMMDKCMTSRSTYHGKLEYAVTMIGATFDGSMWFHVAMPCAMALGNFMLGFSLSLKKYLTVLYKYIIY
ncbi:hypothetical protein Fcan01_06381 [Folsomia candida]|uniref:Uncharacterized protein n=1 Tax=Folsomia candida TaxID=158441 RepID=A0A226ENA3_FOLCA|nr:hypothetical protein Fcan01_06381 [Folsomia candida]